VMAESAASLQEWAGQIIAGKYGRCCRIFG
jgi:hypothetical protein